MKLQLIIRGKMPSLNEYISKINGNRYIGNSFKRKLQDDICRQILMQTIGFDKPFKKQVDFHITYFEKNKKRDKDNIASSKKFLLDSLVESGILQNDGWKWVGDFQEDFEIADDYAVRIIMKEK